MGDQIRVNTGDIRNSASSMDNAAQTFSQRYRQLQETINSTQISGPVKDAIQKKLDEKAEIFQTIQSKIEEARDYSDDQAVKGDQLIDDLQGSVR